MELCVRDSRLLIEEHEELVPRLDVGRGGKGRMGEVVGLVGVDVD